MLKPDVFEAIKNPIMAIKETNVRVVRAFFCSDFLMIKMFITERAIRQAKIKSNGFSVRSAIDIRAIARIENCFFLVFGVSAVGVFMVVWCIGL